MGSSFDLSVFLDVQNSSRSEQISASFFVRFTTSGDIGKARSFLGVTDLKLRVLIMLIFARRGEQAVNMKVAGLKMHLDATSTNTNMTATSVNPSSISVLLTH
jgi:hypothetical protein